MFLVAVIIFLIIPIIEITAMVIVADAIGVWAMLASLILVSLLGAWLVKREGVGVVRRFRETTARGEVPTTEVLDGALIFAAGVLCVVPGFVTDAIGLLLLLPVVRAFGRRRITKRFRILGAVSGVRSFRRRSAIDVEWIGDVTPRDPRSATSAPIELGPGRD